MESYESYLRELEEEYHEAEYRVELRVGNHGGFACFLVGGGGEETIGVFRDLEVAEEFALGAAYDNVCRAFRSENGNLTPI